MGLIDLIRHLTKRTKVEEWELELLWNVFVLLSGEYEVYARQIRDGLIAGVLLSDIPKPNYVNLAFDPRISRKYENERERFFRLRGIKIFDKNSNEWDTLEIYVAHGLVCGYCIPTGRKNRPNFTDINVKSFGKEYLDEDSLQLMEEFLNESEIALINPSDFYEVSLEGKEYYHVLDLEDGDFIGIDRDKNVYQITHDPFEIRLLDGDILSNLSNY